VEDATIPSSGSVKINIQCTQTGTIGNAGANSIIFISGNITGVSSVTNEDEIKGGTDVEDDDSLIARILEYDESQGDSYVGNVADYKRWATTVDGVGSATVIPANDDSGTVTIIITDSNGKPATEELCEKVYNYIMRPDEPESRLAPINTILSIIPPTTIDISIKATVELDEGATIESAKISFISSVTSYLSVAMEEKEIKYTKIAAALSAASGINDFSGLLIGINGEALGTSNITIETMSIPVISNADIELTSGNV
jgi:uncharacterized phage protein gp47/JayE